jgi:uncharacterized membrane protein
VDRGLRSLIFAYTLSGQMMVSLGSVIVNVMTPTARQYYNLEKLWRKGETVNLQDVIKPNAPLGSSKTMAGLDALPEAAEPDDAAEADEDPFWS